MATTATPKTVTSTITIKLRNKLVKIHASRRHRKAISYMREHIARHFKSSPDSIKISQRLNEYMEANGTNRLKPITISISKTGELVEAALPGEKKVEKAPEKKQASATTATAAKPAEAKSAASTPAKSSGTATTAATATTKTAAQVQKEVAKDIGKKVEQKKSEAKDTAKKDEKKAAAAPQSEPKA